MFEHCQVALDVTDPFQPLAHLHVVRREDECEEYGRFKLPDRLLFVLLEGAEELIIVLVGPGGFLMASTIKRGGTYNLQPLNQRHVRELVGERESDGVGGLEVDWGRAQASDSVWCLGGGVTVGAELG